MCAIMTRIDRSKQTMAYYYTTMTFKFGVGPLPQVCWVGYAHAYWQKRVVNVKPASQNLHLPMFDCIGW